MYEELDERLQSSTHQTSTQIEEHKDAVINIFHNLGDEITALKTSVLSRVIQAEPDNNDTFATPLSGGSREEYKYIGDLQEVKEEGEWCQLYYI